MARLHAGGRTLKENDGSWVSVFASADAGRVAVVKSIPEGAGIPCVARNDDAGPILSLYNRSAALVELQVSPADREIAEEALAGLSRGKRP